MILKKIEKCYSNRIKEIKTLHGQSKRRAIGSLVCDIGGNCISCLSKIFKTSWSYIKKCYFEYLGLIPQKEEKRGRKPLTEIYPQLKDDIKSVIEEYASTDPDFKTEKRYVKLTLQEIRNRLIQTGNYTEENCIKKSALDNLIKQMGYELKKVKKTKPLKKIEENDDIFSNVHEKKEEAMNDKNTALISLDTKDKVLLGPFSRGGKNRIQVEAVDHELTNNCLIPFGILDLKRNIPYFFNYTSKPTSLDLVDCIEEFYVEQYLNAEVNKLAILLDNGPDNSGVRTIFLKGLVDISKKYNVKIELIYYPPYHSKYNPVERLWARLENIWNGYLLESVDICLNFMKNLTWKGTKSVTKLKEVKYEKGLKIGKKQMKELEEKYITRTAGIEKWSVIIAS